MTLIKIAGNIFKILFYLVGFAIGLIFVGFGGMCASFTAREGAGMFVISLGVILLGLYLCFVFGREIWKVAMGFTKTTIIPDAIKIETKHNQDDAQF